MTTISISLTVNGQTHSLGCSPRRRLLDVLREDLGLTGTKEGCGQGQCGACSILVDGALVKACLTQVGGVTGKSITTVEGLGSPQGLHPLQEAFLQAGAVQCGFCTPGMLMASKALLDYNPTPSPKQVKEALADNLCRCTGYVKIIQAVLRAAAALRGEGPPGERAGGVMGRSPLRIGGLEKVLGSARYAADLSREEMLHAQLLRSPHSHALILNIDTSQAEALPGVKAVLTHRDVPGTKHTGIAFKDRPVLAIDKVRHLGEPVAVVAATSREVARKALSLIRVDYQPLEAVFDPLLALQGGAPRVHEKGNLAATRRIVKGDVEEGFRQADVVVEATYTTPFHEHAYLEPEAGLSYVDEQGRVVLCVPTQGAHHNQREVAEILGVAPDRVRVIQAVTGGAFGGKTENSVHGVLALLAYRLGKPVKMVYTRRESFLASSKDPPFHLRCKTGATREGRLTASQIEIIANSGAYAHITPVVLTRAAIHATGPYHVPHVLVEGRVVYTNGPFGGPWRGYGVPQAVFAHESQMDLLAHRLGMDPFNFRRLNALERGQETAVGHPLEEPGLRPVLQALEPYYAESTRALARAASRSSSPWRRGVGLACAWKGIGTIGVPNQSEAWIELGLEGKVKLLTGACDIGQGSSTTLAQIAAQELGLPLECVQIVSGDTDLTPDSGVSSAGRQTYATGNAAQSAARSLREALLSTASRALEKKVEDLTFADGHLTSHTDPALRLPLSELANFCREAGTPLRHQGVFDPPRSSLDPQTGQGVIPNPNVFAAQMAEVEVNIRTGEVRVERVVAAQDAGKAIHPTNLEGQLEGGVMMGLGLALKEEFVPGQTHGFGQYAIPKAPDMPEITTIVVEEAEPRGPFGATGGVGELSPSPTAPAIANAIYNACGARIFDLPATRDRVLRALVNPWIGRRGGG